MPVTIMTQTIKIKHPDGTYSDINAVAQDSVLEYVGKVTFSADGSNGNVTLTDKTTTLNLVPNEDALPVFDFFVISQIHSGVYTRQITFVGYEAAQDLSSVTMTFDKSTKTDTLYAPCMSFQLYRLRR